MANNLTPNDVYALMNEIVSEATGRDDISVVDTSSFTSVGETLLRTGAENTLNAISTVLARTIFSVRPYKSKFDSIRIAGERWGAMVRKVVTLYSETEQSDDWNTSENTSTLNDGNSIDMFKIKKSKQMQINFYGTKLIQKHLTFFRDQLSLAFSNETEFSRFIDAVMTQFYNEIEMVNENKARLTLLNFMAGISSMGLYEVDLVQAFNTKFNTTYTREQLLTTYLTNFLKFVTAEIKIYSDRLTDMSVNYHASIDGYEKIMRHTPKDKQRMIMYGPFFTDSSANVLPEIFNPEYLNIGDFEKVNYWQSQNDPTSIKITPNILNTATGESKTSDTDVELDYVLGCLFDVDAVGWYNQFDYASTTPFNSAGGYWNQFTHMRFNSVCDFTENGILFVLGEGGE